MNPLYHALEFYTCLYTIRWSSSKDSSGEQCSSERLDHQNANLTSLFQPKKRIEDLAENDIVYAKKKREKKIGATLLLIHDQRPFLCQQHVLSLRVSEVLKLREKCLLFRIVFMSGWVRL